MQRYRYTGPDASRDLALPGGVITFPRMQWVDPAAVAEETGIGVHHLPIVLAGLGPDWQAEGPVKAARTRKAKAKPEQVEDPGVQPDEQPDESGEEQA